MAFERTTAQGNKIIEASKRAGEAITGAFGKTFTTGKDGAGKVGGFLGNAADRVGGIAGKAVSGPLKIVGGVFNRFPVIATVTTVVGGTVLVSKFFRGRAEQRANLDMAELQAAQQRAGMAQANANTVTPAEYAAMEARMRQGGQGQGFAANVAAERAQGAAGPAV